jgi:hypothetical protein
VRSVEGLEDEQRAELEAVALAAGLPLESVLAMLREEEAQARALELETRKPVRYTNRAARREAERAARRAAL